LNKRSIYSTNLGCLYGSSRPQFMQWSPMAQARAAFNLSPASFLASLQHLMSSVLHISHPTLPNNRPTPFLPEISRGLQFPNSFSYTYVSMIQHTLAYPYSSRSPLSPVQSRAFPKARPPGHMATNNVIMIPLDDNHVLAHSKTTAERDLLLRPVVPKPRFRPKIPALAPAGHH
jgi:hypothetical protein